MIPTERITPIVTYHSQYSMPLNHVANRTAVMMYLTMSSSKSPNFSFLFLFIRFHFSFRHGYSTPCAHFAAKIEKKRDTSKKLPLFLLFLP